MADNFIGLDVGSTAVRAVRLQSVDSDGFAILGEDGCIIMQNKRPLLRGRQDMNSVSCIHGCEALLIDSGIVTHNQVHKALTIT